MTAARDAELLEKSAIRETLLRYAAGIDRRDWDLMLSCFTDDVVANFQGNDLGRGKDRILAYITQLAAGFTIHSSIHMLANMYIELHGDRATAVTYGIGYLVFDAGEGPRLRTRHLHYADDLVRTSDGSWLIAQRTLTNEWERFTAVDPL
jgi:ketosteroid isomerase-like protein